MLNFTFEQKEDPNATIDYGMIFVRRIAYGQIETCWEPFRDFTGTTFEELQQYHIDGGREPNFRKINRTNIADKYGYEYWGVENVPENLPQFLFSPGVSAVMIDG